MSTNKIFAALGSVAAIVAVASGLYISGSPGEQRLLRLDERRVRDLQMIADQIDGYWQTNDALPRDLDALVAAQRLRDVPVDPVSGDGYEYEANGTDGYRLCATFDRPSGESERPDFWEHAAGRQCFALCRGQRCDDRGAR